MYDRIKSLIIYVVLATVIIKSLMMTGIFRSTTFNGDGFKVSIPSGWEMSKERSREKKYEETKITTFVTQEKDSDDIPQAVITLLSKKLEQAIWIEDEFPNIVQAIRVKYKVIDKGEIKLDNQLTKWVFYEDKKNNLLNLDFYLVTEASKFYKIQFSAFKEHFKKHRPAFEELRESFKLDFSLF